MARVCIFGASTVWGAVDPEAGGWADRLKKYLYESTRGDVLVHNLGISGDNTEGLLKRIEVECEARKPSLVLIAIGTNDSWYSGTPDKPSIALADFRRNLRELVKIGREFTEAIVFVGLMPCDEAKTMPIPWDPEGLICYDNVRLKAYDDAIRTFCEQEKLPYVDLWDALVPDELKDGLHPNSEGHRKLFEVIKDKIEELQLLKGVAPRK